MRIPVSTIMLLGRWGSRAIERYVQETELEDLFLVAPPAPPTAPTPSPAIADTAKELDLRQWTLVQPSDQVHDPATQAAKKPRTAQQRKGGHADLLAPGHPRRHCRASRGDTGQTRIGLQVQGTRSRRQHARQCNGARSADGRTGTPSSPEPMTMAPRHCAGSAFRSPQQPRLPQRNRCRLGPMTSRPIAPAHPRVEEGNRYDGTFGKRGLAPLERVCLVRARTF